MVDAHKSIGRLLRYQKRSRRPPKSEERGGKRGRGGRVREKVRKRGRRDVDRRERREGEEEEAAASRIQRIGASPH